MSKIDTALKAAGVALAVCLSILALMAALALQHRTTAATTGEWPGVFREDLVSQRIEYCTLQRTGRVVCTDTGSSFNANDRSVPPAP